MVSSVSNASFSPQLQKQIRQDIQNIIRENDKDGDEQLNLTEASKAGLPDKETFSRIDKNKDDRLSSQEIEIAVQENLTSSAGLSANGIESEGGAEGGSGSGGGDGGEGGAQTVLSGAASKKKLSLVIKSKIALLEAQARSKQAQAQTADPDKARQIEAEARRLEAQAKALKSNQSVNKTA